EALKELQRQVEVAPLPSQQRYLGYFAQFLEGTASGSARRLRLCKAMLSGVPGFETEGAAFRPFVEVRAGETLYSSFKGQGEEVWPSSYAPTDSVVSFPLPTDLVVSGDVLVEDGLSPMQSPNGNRQVQLIRDACSVAPAERSAEQVHCASDAQTGKAPNWDFEDRILTFVQDVNFFTELPRAQQRALCQVMTLEAVKNRAKIFDVGEVGDKFYIILTGACIVQVPVEPVSVWKRPPKEEPDMQTLAQLKEGQGFGELALQERLLLVQPRW
ncbi:unnamed protein product, partial [Effrenium voratum]